MEGEVSKDLGEARHLCEEPRECFISHRDGHYRWEGPGMEKHLDQHEGEAFMIAQGEDRRHSSKEVLEATNHARDEWMLSSRGPCHESPIGSWSKSFKEMEEAELQYDMEACQILNLGEIRLEKSDDSKVDLQEVRYVPDVMRNLISLNALDANGSETSFGKGSIKVNKGGEALLDGTLKDELYVEHTAIGEAIVTDSKDKCSSQRCHLELGNLSLAEVNKQSLSTSGQGEELKIWEKNSEIFRSGAADVSQVPNVQMARINYNLIEKVQEHKGKLQQRKIQKQKTYTSVMDSIMYGMASERAASTYLSRVLNFFVFDPGGQIIEAPYNAIKYGKNSSSCWWMQGGARKEMSNY